MKILALETSGVTGSAALLQGNGETSRLVAEQRLPEQQRSAQSLLPTIQQLLSAEGWEATDVELIATATGPGSFTGLRIGVTAAKTLAFVAGAALVGVNTLAALAENAGEFPETLWTVLDAQRQQWFAASFQRQDLLAQQAAPRTEVLAIESWLARLKSGDVVCGPPLEKLKARLPEGVLLANPESLQPPASAVGKLGYQLFCQGQTVDPLQLVPQYHRLSAAEEKFRKV